MQGVWVKKVTIDPTLMDEDKYNDNLIEEDAECLMRAEEIEKDPKRMELVQAYLEHKKNKITSLQDLKDLSNNFKHKVEPMKDFTDDDDKDA